MDDCDSALNACVTHIDIEAIPEWDIHRSHLAVDPRVHERIRDIIEDHVSGVWIGPSRNPRTADGVVPIIVMIIRPTPRQREHHRQENYEFHKELKQTFHYMLLSKSGW